MIDHQLHLFRANNTMMKLILLYFALSAFLPYIGCTDLPGCNATIENILGSSSLLTLDNVKDLVTSTAYSEINNGISLDTSMCNTLTDANQINICNKVITDAILSLQFKKVILDATISLAQCVGVSEYNNISQISQPILTNVPTAVPTIVPTAAPTHAPTIVPTAAPTHAPTIVLTAAPTHAPTIIPTKKKHTKKSFNKTKNTDKGRAAPTHAPTIIPTKKKHTKKSFNKTKNTDKCRAAPTHAPTMLVPTKKKHTKKSFNKTKNTDKGRNLLQLQSCAGTSQCFQACPSCQRYSTVCTPSGRVVANAACGTLGLGVSVYVRYIVTTGFCVAGGLLCGPADPACAGACIAALSGISAIGIATPCALTDIALCDEIKSACDTCNIQNDNLCNPSTTQCCAGETGTACGANCCCCPNCQAPSGPNCACAAAPCF